MIQGILLDIEGTTTPIRFVYDVLFPFARAHAHEFLDEEAQRALKLDHEREVAKRLEPAPPSWSSGALAYVHWMIDQDRKSTALKDLQGKIWQDGYRRGELHGEVFPDVPPALEKWHRSGIDVRIFSSGSILAQQLIFSTTPQGDLTRFISGYYDTTTGPKGEASSYETIAASFALPAEQIVFISDVVRELDAAAKANLQVRLALRPGNHPQPQNSYRSVASFSEI